MGAEQKRMDCVKSSWEGKTSERARCQTGAETSDIAYHEYEIRQQRKSNYQAAKQVTGGKMQSVNLQWDLMSSEKLDTCGLKVRSTSCPMMSGFSSYPSNMEASTW